MDNLSDLQAVIFGLVQGLGEFLPISSSGHLVILPHFMDWQDPGLDFNIALHLGTLFAVLIYFKKDWYCLASEVFRKRASRRQPMLNMLIVGSLPGAVAGILLKDYAETVFRSPILVGSTLISFGAILYFADKRSKKQKALEDITLKDAFLIGTFQAMALIPGVSRSGITITAALFLGFTRQSASKFSFLLSAPIIAGASILGLKDMNFTGLTNTNVLIAVVVSFVSGALSIHFLLKWVSRWDFGLFSAYRLILGIVIFSLFL